MIIKLEDPKILANLISIISELVTEVKLKVNKEGMNLSAFDPAGVAMVHFNIPSELFSQFEVTNEEILGVNLNDLKAVLRRIGFGSSLIMEKKENLLRIEIKDRIKREFMLALIEVETEDRELPKWEFNSVIKMDSDAFVEAVEDCTIVSDACTFIAEPNRFIVQAKGLNSAKAEFSSDEVEIHSGSSTARYSLDYLNKFIKGAKVSSKVALNFSDDHPLRVNFQTGKIILSFVLAPRKLED